MAEPVASALPPILRDMLAARRQAVTSDWIYRASWTFSDEGYRQLRRSCTDESWPLDSNDPATGQPVLVLGLPWSIDHAQPELFKLGVPHGSC